MHVHKQVNDKREKEMLLRMARKNHDQVLNLEIGEFVLWSRVDEVHWPKLWVTWLGPYRVTGVTAHAVEIEHLITHDKRMAHPSRVKFYAEADLDVNDEILEHVSRQGVLLKVEKVLDARWNADVSNYQLLVKWDGLEEIESSWENLDKMKRETPKIVDAYLVGMKNESMKKSMLQSLA